jgi:hypothetical protein
MIASAVGYKPYHTAQIVIFRRDLDLAPLRHKDLTHTARPLPDWKDKAGGTAFFL